MRLEELDLRACQLAGLRSKKQKFVNRLQKESNTVTVGEYVHDMIDAERKSFGSLSQFLIDETT